MEQRVWALVAVGGNSIIIGGRCWVTTAAAAAASAVVILPFTVNSCTRHAVVNNQRLINKNYIVASFIRVPLPI